jgi:glucan phosphorylase
MEKAVMKNSGITVTDERERTRTGLSVEALERAIVDNLFYMQGRFRDVATLNDDYMATAYTVRDCLLARWIKTATKHDLANWINRRLGVSLDPTSLFGVQVKRIHEYKRQHLNTFAHHHLV